MWNSLVNALEKTGDVITNAATNAGKSARLSSERVTTEANQARETAATTDPPSTAADSTASQSTTASHYASSLPRLGSSDMMKQLQAGLTSVVETTSQSLKQAHVKTTQSLKQAQEKLQAEQEKLLSRARVVYYKRNVALPLDVDALRDAQVVYLTDRLITMSHPAMASAVRADITAERKLAAVGHLLQKRHEGRFMVWNLSEVDYDIDILDDQVLTFSFPGSPSPPLGLLLKLLLSMESWLKADPRNVAVVHCLTGKGRTSTVLAAFLCWMGEAGFHDVPQALQYIAQCKQTTVDELTIPSQRRYASYFKNMLDHVRPSQPPLLLKRIILSGAPKFAKGPPLADSSTSASSTQDSELRLGCAPYLQLFKSGQLLYTAAPVLANNTKSVPNEITFCQVADGSITFPLDQIVQGDILVRCRHISSNRRHRISMFRAAFHTGYVPHQNMMRLTKSQLDGACHDNRFADDFYIDLIFEVAPKVMTTTAEEESSQKEEATIDTEAVTDDAEQVAANNDTTETDDAAHVFATGTTVTASSYDTMLHRDSRFWEVIAARRKEQAENEKATNTAETTVDNNTTVGDVTASDPLWGPTVGRRRDFSKANDHPSEAVGTTTSLPEQNALRTFSIGGELDFLPDPQSSTPAQPAKTKPQRKKDSLMEALMGALDEEVDDDDDDGHDGVEEIVFSNVPKPSPTVSLATPTMVELPPKAEKPKEAMLTQGSSEQLASNEDSKDVVSTLEEKTNQDSATTKEQNDMDDVLAEANLELDENMDELLGADDNDDDDVDYMDGNMDDAELEDLENFLSPSNKQ